MKPSFLAAASGSSSIGARFEKPHLTIEPKRGWAKLDIAEIWRFRNLLLTLAGRDVTLRYRQTALGVIWVIFQPLLAAGIFSFVFGKVANLPSDGVPYFLFSYAGLLGWNAFSTTLTKASICLIGNSQLISKVYFPRMILPLSTVFSTLIDFAVAFGMMTVLIFVHHISPQPAMLLLPIWLLFILMLAAGVGLYTSALTVSYRDVQYVLPVLIQFLLYASPVAYAVSKVPARYQTLYFLNPLAGLLQAFRWSLLGVDRPSGMHLLYSCTVSFVVLLVGASGFKSMERKFADVI